MPVFHGWAEHDGFPLIVLEDLATRTGRRRGATATSTRSRALSELAASEPPAGLEPVPRDDLAYEWSVVERDPEPFLATGFCTRKWLEEHLPVLRDAAERAPFEGVDLLHLDVHIPQSSSDFIPAASQSKDGVIGRQLVDS